MIYNVHKCTIIIIINRYVKIPWKNTAGDHSQCLASHRDPGMPLWPRNRVPLRGRPPFDENLCARNDDPFKTLLFYSMIYYSNI